MNRQIWEEELCRYDEQAAQAAKRRWDSIAKPLGSLGVFERMVVDIAGLTGNPDYRPEKRAVAVLCADNGVVRQGVTQTGSEVTAIVARNLTTGDASVCRFADIARADVVPVDMGMCQALGLPGLLDRRVAPGTGDISEGPAMSREQAELAVSHGMRLAGDLKARGYQIIATGEMGIGNTTTSSAVASVLLKTEPALLTGRGAGLSGAGLKKKIAVIERAIEVNRPEPEDAWDVLSKLGGFDIAGMAGLFLGGAMYGIPIVIDGLISAVAALCAVRLRPEASIAAFASHVSAEPAGRILLRALGKTPVIDAGMYLGEGSGAVALLPLLDMAYAVYGEMVTFDETNIESYQPLR